MYTLWRNHVQLGRLTQVDEEFNDDSSPLGFASLLVPMVPLEELGDVKQTRYGEMPGAPAVQEFPDTREHTDFSEASMRQCYIPLPAYALLDKDGRGVPDADVLSVRTEDGLDVPSYIISLHRYDVRPHPNLAANLKAMGFAEDTRSIIEMVFIHEDGFPPKHIRDLIRDMPDDPE